MKIRIIKPGLLTTIQDMGRVNHLAEAVPFSGAMDKLSAQIANLAVGNNTGDAVIEFTQNGAAFVAEDDALLAFSGDGAWLRNSENRLPADRPVFVPSGTELYLENNKSGNCSYLAVAGGWDVPEVLGSRSTYVTANFGGFNGRCLRENDELCNKELSNTIALSILTRLKGDTVRYPNWSIARELFLSADRKIIRVMKGREFNWFDDDPATGLFSESYTISHNSNRMGYHLQGPRITRALPGELLSTAVCPGTIQVTNNGDLIMLMADCQTTGGYPRIVQVAAVDLPLCAQLKPGDAIRFKEISWKEAEKLYIQQQHDLHKLALAIARKYD